MPDASPNPAEGRDTLIARLETEEGYARNANFERLAELLREASAALVVQQAEITEGLKAEGQKDEWVQMLSDALRRVVVAVSGDDEWQGSVADGLDLLNARFQEVNGALEQVEAQLREAEARVRQLELVMLQLSPDEAKALAHGLDDMAAGRVVPLPPRSGELHCVDCGAVYAEFPLDTILPDEQWRQLFGHDGGILCASCIVRRAGRLHGAIALKARIEFAGDPPARAATDEALARLVDLIERIMWAVMDHDGHGFVLPTDSDGRFVPADYLRQMADVLLALRGEGRT